MSSKGSSDVAPPATDADLCQWMIMYLLDNLQPYLWTKKSVTIKNFDEYFFSQYPEISEQDARDLLTGRGGKGRGLLETVSNTNWANGQFKPSARVALDLLVRLLDAKQNPNAKVFSDVLKSVDKRHIESMCIGKHVNGKGGNREGSLKLIRFFKQHRPDVEITVEVSKGSDAVVLPSDARMKRRSSIYQQLTTSTPLRSDFQRRMSTHSAYKDLIARNVLRPDKHSPTKAQQRMQQKKKRSSTLDDSKKPMGRMASFKRFFKFKEDADSTSTLVFGVPLAAVYRNMDCAAQPLAIPPLIKYGCETLERRGMKRVGLFRLPGSSKRVRETKALLDTGIAVDFASLKVDTITSLIKLWFRELPEPVCTFSRYEQWVDAFDKHSTDEERVEAVCAICSDLPPRNRVLLAYLLAFLERVAAHSAKHKMGTKNLSVVFAPNLIRQKDESYQRMVQDSASVMGVTNLMIIHHKKLFPDLPFPSAEDIAAEKAAADPVSMSESEPAMSGPDPAIRGTSFDDSQLTSSSFTGQLPRSRAMSSALRMRAGAAAAAAAAGAADAPSSDASSSGGSSGVPTAVSTDSFPQFAEMRARSHSSAVTPALAARAAQMRARMMLAQKRQIEQTVVQDSVLEVDEDSDSDDSGSDSGNDSDSPDPKPEKQKRGSVIESMDDMIDFMLSS